MSLNFDDYRDRYSTIEMERDGGILQLRFHSEGGPLRWSGLPHAEFGHAFSDIARDPENRVIIMTGTGEEFSGPTASKDTVLQSEAGGWENTRREGMLLTTSLLNLDAIVISAINGPALRHPEIPLLADIVLASPDTTFQDSAHFVNRVVPGDGVNFVFPALLGLARARYFLLTGQLLTVQEAHELGIVHEILPREQLLPRARELAEQLITQNPLVLKYTRLLLTQELKRTTLDLLGYGLALEGLAQINEMEIRRDDAQ